MGIDTLTEQRTKRLGAVCDGQSIRASVSSETGVQAEPVTQHAWRQAARA
jgi:hypothetical protein